MVIVVGHDVRYGRRPTDGFWRSGAAERSVAQPMGLPERRAGGRLAVRWEGEVEGSAAQSVMRVEQLDLGRERSPGWPVEGRDSPIEGRTEQGEERKCRPEVVEDAVDQPSVNRGDFLCDDGDGLRLVGFARAPMFTARGFLMPSGGDVRVRRLDSAAARPRFRRQARTDRVGVFQAVNQLRDRAAAEHRPHEQRQNQLGNHHEAKH